MRWGLSQRCRVLRQARVHKMDAVSIHNTGGEISNTILIIFNSGFHFHRNNPYQRHGMWITTFNTNRSFGGGPHLQVQQARTFEPGKHLVKTLAFEDVTWKLLWTVCLTSPHPKTLSSTHLAKRMPWKPEMEITSYGATWTILMLPAKSLWIRPVFSHTRPDEFQSWSSICAKWKQRKMKEQERKGTRERSSFFFGCALWDWDPFWTKYIRVTNGRKDEKVREALRNEEAARQRFDTSDGQWVAENMLYVKSLFVKIC